MAKKILLIEQDPQVIELVRYPLEDEGYLVVTATDGQEGLRKAKREQPDLALVAFKLSKKMPGNRVVKRLRKDPATDHVKIVMIADEQQLEHLEIGPGSSADDFLIKPFTAVELVTKVAPLLAADGDHEAVISSGNGELDSKMGGGIPLGSLTLIEGDSGAGKSVLSQQMMHGCLADGYQTALFTSENTVRSLVKQMRSLNLEIVDYLLLKKLRIYSIETAGLNQAPPDLIKAMKQEESRDLIFLDSITSSIPESNDRGVLHFFEQCKRLCADGTTVIVVIHSHGLTRELIIRIRSLCDAHLQLHTEEVGNKLVKTLEVTKIRGAEQHTGNIISFEVEPGWGMRVIPLSKVRG
jgi:flagellar protein FlaH